MLPFRPCLQTNLLVNLVARGQKLIPLAFVDTAAVPVIGILVGMPVGSCKCIFKYSEVSVDVARVGH